jgi:hypothetical protein
MTERRAERSYRDALEETVAAPQLPEQSLQLPRTVLCGSGALLRGGDVFDISC